MRCLFPLGNTVYQFLQRCLESLRKDFHELKTISADQLMYVKEDLIIPHHYSFYDFIVTKVCNIYVRSVLIHIIYEFVCFIRLEVRVGRCFLLMCTMMSVSLVMQVWRRTSLMLAKYYWEAGTRGTNTFSLVFYCYSTVVSISKFVVNWDFLKSTFLASRWEPYDPTKTYEKYSIKDKGKKTNVIWNVRSLSRIEYPSSFTSVFSYFCQSVFERPCINLHLSSRM